MYVCQEDTFSWLVYSLLSVSPGTTYSKERGVL